MTDNLLERVAGRLSAEFAFSREDADRIARAAINAMSEASNDRLQHHDRLREALVKCRDKFAEYAELHRAKTLGALSIPERKAVDEKVKRNLEMVAICDRALTQSGNE